jgi:hypothetical protein
MHTQAIEDDFADSKKEKKHMLKRLDELENKLGDTAKDKEKLQDEVYRDFIFFFLNDVLYIFIITINRYEKNNKKSFIRRNRRNSKD